MAQFDNTLAFRNIKKIKKSDGLVGTDIDTIADNRAWIILTSSIFHTILATPLLFIQFGIVITPFEATPLLIPTLLSLLFMAFIAQVIVVGFVIKTDGNAVCVYRAFSRQTFPLEKSHIEIGFSFFYRWHSIYIYYLRHKIKLTRGFSFNIRNGTGFFIDMIAHRKKVAKFKRFSRTKKDQ